MGDIGAPQGQIGMPNQPLPAGSLFIHTQGIRARLRLRTGMGLGKLAWVHGRAWAANNTVRPVIFPSSLLSHLVPATIADKPRPPGLTHSIFAVVVKDTMKRGRPRGKRQPQSSTA